MCGKVVAGGGGGASTGKHETWPAGGGGPGALYGEMLEVGLPTHLAVRLFEQRLVTLAQAAKLGGRSVEEFLDVLRASGVAAVDYPPEELEAKLDALA